MTEKKTSSSSKKGGSASSGQTQGNKSKPGAETKSAAGKTAPQKGNHKDSSPTKNTSSATGHAVPAKPRVSSEELMHMIAEQAYYLAEKRGFNGGDPVADWLAAEQKVKTQFAA